jgi:hypothetical protein
MSFPSGVLRFAGIWNAASTYVPGMLVQSSLVNNSYAVLQTVTGGSDPSVALGPDWVAFPEPTSGIYVETMGGSATATVPAPACKPSSVVIATYIHTGGGGGAQYIKSITPGTGSFVIVCNTAIDALDAINWFIPSL